MGTFLSDRALLADPVTAALRGDQALPSTSTLWRFVTGADLGRVSKAAALDDLPQSAAGTPRSAG